MAFAAEVRASRLRGPPSGLGLLVGDGCSRPIEFRDVNGERLVIAFSPVPQAAERNLLTQQDRPVG